MLRHNSWLSRQRCLLWWRSFPTFQFCILFVAPCWNSIVRLSSNESVFTYVWITSWSEIIWTLRHSTIRRWPSSFPGQGLVAGPVSRHISVYIHWLASVLFPELWLRYGITAHSTFVCQPDANWGHWASKCCYSCLFCTLEQWLLHFPVSKGTVLGSSSELHFSSSHGSAWLVDGGSLTLELGARFRFLEQLQVLAHLVACTECVTPFQLE